MNNMLLAATAAVLACEGAMAAEIRVSSLGWREDDSTEFLQKALDSGADTVIVDKAKGPWVTLPLFARSNQTVIFEKGVEVVAKKGAFRGLNDCLFTCRGVTNVTIRGYGALLRMHRADYAGPAYRHGEWRHSVAILGSDKVTVEGLTLLESGGDGVYVGANSGRNQLGAPSTDIVLRDLVCDRHLRQGMSIITARGLLIERCVMKNTWGAPPAAGIDFEPNRPGEELVNCVMRDCTIINNQGNGIEMCLMQLDGTCAPVSITLENCRVHGCGRSIAFSSYNKPTFPRGFIRLKGCSFVDAQREALFITRKPLDAYSVEFEDCKFVNANTAAPVATEVTDLVLCMRNWNDATTDGIRFERCTVRQPVPRDWISTVTPTLIGKQVSDITGSVTVISPTGERKLNLDQAWMQSQFREVVPGGMPPYKPFDAAGAIRTDLPPALPKVMVPLAPASVRHHATYRFFAGAAGRVRIRGRQMLLGKNAPTQTKMTLFDEGGKAIATSPMFPAQEKEIAFDVPGAGFYRMEVPVKANVILLNAANVPMALEVPESFVNLISTTGKFRFRKPEAERAALVFRGDGNEKVNATVIDSEGRTVWARDGIGETEAFVAEPPAKSGLWTMELRPPTNAAFEDCSILMRGLAPELFLTDVAW